jgi:DNA-binding NtrC family response regulator
MVSAVQSLRMQVLDYLPKPFVTQALATQVRKVPDS